MDGQRRKADADGDVLGPRTIGDEQSARGQLAGQVANGSRFGSRLCPVADLLDDITKNDRKVKGELEDKIKAALTAFAKDFA